MRKLCVISLLLVTTLATWAITQPGYVRTISRPNYESQRLNGVLIRVRGNHNPIISTETGDFSILMQDLRIGDPYVLSAVMKSGYQLVEQDFIGRNQVGSDRIPLVVSMVSTAQLQAEKAAIATRARAGVERYYMERLQTIEQELSAQKLTAEQYEQQIAALDDKLMQSEQQIEQMADRYARTDYALLDSVAGLIQQAIEQGDLDQAEQLIKQKGTLRERQQHVANLQRAAASQLQDLKQDYYHLHSIALSRFEPDSASLYLKQRADLDTTDAAATLDYAKFLNEYQRDRDEAYRYVLRAEHQVIRDRGEHGVLMLRVLGEKAVCYYRYAKTDAHLYSLYLPTMQEATALSEDLYGAESCFTATRKVTLGAAYYSFGRLAEAKSMLQEALRVYHLPGEGDAVEEGNALSNLGMVAFAEKDYEQARSYFEQSVFVLRSASADCRTLPLALSNLAAICMRQKDMTAARKYYLEAYEKSMRIFGDKNTITKNIKAILDSLH